MAIFYREISLFDEKMEERNYTFGHETGVGQNTITQHVKAEENKSLKYD